MCKKFYSLLVIVIFLSTFFVGCKPQEEPIALEDIALKAPKEVKKKKPVRTILKEDVKKPEVKSEKVNNKFAQEVIVNVTAENVPLTGATVNLASKTSAGNVVFEKQTDTSGKAKFVLRQLLPFFYVTAYSKEYAAENKMVQNYSFKKSPPVTINLNLKNKGMIITAILEYAPDKIDDFSARIEQSENQTGFPKIFIITTNITENEIIFPPIPTNLKNLRVCINGKNIPACYSKSFDTMDGIDKTVFVEMQKNTILSGTVKTTDGYPFTNTFTAMVYPTDLSKGIHRSGLVYQKQVFPDTYGSYELSGLAEGVFKIYFGAFGLKPFETNLNIISPETTLDFSFSKITASSFGGIVINGLDNQPIEGITVKAAAWHDRPAYVSCVTDQDGKFSLELKESHNGFFGEIVVDEPGFGKVIKQMRKENKYIKIILSQCGNVIGKVMTKSGKAIAHETVRMEIIEKGEPGKTKRVYYSSDEHVSYQTRTDEKGNYEFLNVAAPAKYGFDIYGKFNSGYSLPSYHSGKGFTVEVEPDKTVEYNLIVQKPGTIAFKGQDAKGNPVLKYDFTYQLRPGSYDAQTRHVNVSKGEWNYFDLSSCGENIFSCQAKENSGGIFSFLKPKKKNLLLAITNGITVYAETTNYITLIFTQSKPNLTGRLFAPNGSPAKKISIRAWVNGGKSLPIAKKVDDEGYFELQGLNLKEGEIMNVEASSWEDKTHIYTNLPSGAKDVELRLRSPIKITGKVFLDNLDTPAKNFTIGEGYNKQSYNSSDGVFVFTMRRPRKGSGNKGIIANSTDNYLSEKVKYEVDKDSVCDVGDIILKSGN